MSSTKINTWYIVVFHWNQKLFCCLLTTTIIYYYYYYYYLFDAGFDLKTISAKGPYTSQRAQECETADSKYKLLEQKFNNTRLEGLGSPCNKTLWPVISPVNCLFVEIYLIKNVYTVHRTAQVLLTIHSHYQTVPFFTFRT